MLQSPSTAPLLRRLGVLALLLLAVTAVAEERSGFPALVVDPPVVEFGTLGQEMTRTKTIILSNDGGAPLAISEIETTCGCTAAKPEKMLLQPGERTSMLVTFDSKLFQGHQEKFIRIHSNDAADPITQISVTAMVKAPLIFTPGNKLLGFGRTRAEDAEPQVVLVASPDGVPLEIECTRTNEAKLRTTIEPDANAGPSRAVITITLQPDVIPGEIREVLSFKTNVPDMATFDIEISGQIVDDLEMTPLKHNFRYVTEGQELSRLFIVKMPRGYDMTITGAEIDLPEFDVDSITLDEATGNWHVMIKGKAVTRDHPLAKKSRGRVKGTLTVSTDDAEQASFQAEVKYMIRL